MNTESSSTTRKALSKPGLVVAELGRVEGIKKSADFGDGVSERPLSIPSAIEVSVVTPLHNEALCVRAFCTRVNAVLNEAVDGHEIIVVDDGSTDDTGAILDELRHSIPELRPLSLTRNFGQSAAVYAGIQHSEGKYVVVMDGDMQVLPEELPRLVDEIREGYDLVSGYRSNRTESWLFRLLPSRIANLRPTLSR